MALTAIEDIRHVKIKMLYLKNLYIPLNENFITEFQWNITVNENPKI